MKIQCFLNKISTKMKRRDIQNNGKIQINFTKVRSSLKKMKEIFLAKRTNSMPLSYFKTTNFVWTSSTRRPSGSILKEKELGASTQKVSNMVISLLNTMENSMNPGDGMREKISLKNSWKRKSWKILFLNFIIFTWRLIRMIQMVMIWWLLIQSKRETSQVASHILAIQTVEPSQLSRMESTILQCMLLETSNMVSN